VQRKAPHLSCSASNKSCNIDRKRGDVCSWIRAFCKGFGLLLTYEIIEELIEEAIAYTITTVIAKAVSFLLVVILTQTVKVTAKGLAKGIVIVLKPLVKKLTYKEGNDKTKKILRFIDMCKEKIKENKFLTFLKNNPKSILGIISGFIASIAGGAVTAGGMYWGNVQLPLWAIIVIGAVVCIALFIFIVLGVNGAGFEGPAKKALRLLANKLGFTKAVEALDKVEQEYEAEEAAKAEAEKIEKERIQAKYQEGWRLDVLNGMFEGSLESYIEEKQKAEAEAEAKIKEEQARLALEEQKRQYRSAVANNGYTGSFTDWQAEYQTK
jgi:hypothetical protein